jgi:hypothetical protein
MGFLFPGIGASGVLEIVLNRNSVAGNGFASLKMAVCTPLAKESPEIAVATHEVGNVFDMEVGVVQLDAPLPKKPMAVKGFDKKLKTALDYNPNKKD